MQFSTMNNNYQPKKPSKVAVRYGLCSHTAVECREWLDLFEKGHLQWLFMEPSQVCASMWLDSL